MGDPAATRAYGQPEDVSEVFDEFEGHYSGPLAAPDGGARSSSAAFGGSTFGVRGAGPFDRSDDDELAAPVPSSLSFGVEIVHIAERHQLGAFATPSIDVALTADQVVGESISARASVTCDLKGLAGRTRSASRSRCRSPG